MVPIYDVEPYLEQCVQSLREQTHANLEIILVDDGSPEDKIREDEFVTHQVLLPCSRVACVAAGLYGHVQRSNSIISRQALPRRHKKVAPEFPGATNEKAALTALTALTCFT